MPASSPRKSVTVNRAPVLTLWASVVAERLGYDREEALTLGKAVAGLNAQSKGRSLGIFHAVPEEKRKARKAKEKGKAQDIELMGRRIATRRTPAGLRALNKDQAIDPEKVEAYLRRKLGDALDDARAALQQLAESRDPEILTEEAYSLYEEFRPTVPRGKKGWGAPGRLDLERIRRRARE